MGILSGGISGASAGMSFGPVGAAIGAGVGALASGIGSIFGNQKAKKKARSLNKDMAEATQRRDASFAMGVGNAEKLGEQNLMANYMATGGKLKTVLDVRAKDNSMDNFMDIFKRKNIPQKKETFKGGGKGNLGGGGAGSSFTTYPYTVRDSTFVQPAIIDYKNFNQAFGEANKAGLDSFFFDDKKYTTELGDNPNNNVVGANRMEANMIPLDTTYLHNV